ncbi:hypothetical protein PQX77_014997 [Marasmius sp. AFHP31]|nr:hypothetical protein PQX77_014997 [Marasmius sp. AFHP31]
MSTYLFSLIATACLLFYVTYQALWCSTRHLNYPPGPTKLPVIGNLLQMPKTRQWVKFREWALEYGPIYHLKAGPDHLVVLNTPEATEELLVKRNRIFDDRMTMHVASEVLSAGQRMVFLAGSSLEYKVIRKELTSSLGPLPSREHQNVQELEATVFLYDLLRHGSQTDILMKGKTSEQELLHDPEFLEQHWFSLVRRFATSVVMLVMYGERVERIKNNRSLHEIYEVVDNLTDCMLPGAFMADTLTFLQKLPDTLSPWRLKAQKMHRRELDVYGGFLDKIRADHESGVNRPDCFVGKYLKARDSMIDRDQVTSGRGLTSDGKWLRDILLAYSAGTVLEAGSDSTASTITSFVLFMLWYPQVLEKAREEIDKIVGAHRLPTFEDHENLPYVVAVIKEVLRCRPPAPLGVPHRSTEDTTYNGYFIPKGSVVIGNIWAIHLDPACFEDPKEFNPDRWMGEIPVRWGGSGTGQTRDHYVFGWGRRFCMGSHIAETSIFMVVARILWGIEMRGPRNSRTGAVQLLDPWKEDSYSTGAVTNAVPFNVVFEPRSSQHKEGIENAFRDAQDQWELLGLRKDER